MIYRLKRPENSYEIVQLSVTQLAKLLDDPKYQIVRKLSSSCQSLADRWNKPSCEPHKHYLDNPLADISFWGNFLVLNQTAFEHLSPVIAQFGEFLPIDVEGFNLTLFNCTALGAEIEEQSLIKYQDGFPIGLETLVFNEQDVSDKAIFKSKLQGCKALFVNEQFKAVCEKHRLSGVIFDEDLLNIFV